MHTEVNFDVGALVDFSDRGENEPEAKENSNGFKDSFGTNQEVSNVK